MIHVAKQGLLVTAVMICMGSMALANDAHHIKIRVYAPAAPQDEGVQRDGALVRSAKSLYKNVLTPLAKGAAVGGIYMLASEGLEHIIQKCGIEYTGLMKVIGSGASVALGLSVLGSGKPAHTPSEGLFKVGLTGLSSILTVAGLHALVHQN